MSPASFHHYFLASILEIHHHVTSCPKVKKQLLKPSQSVSSVVDTKAQLTGSRIYYCSQKLLKYCLSNNRVLIIKNPEVLEKKLLQKQQQQFYILFYINISNSCLIYDAEAQNGKNFIILSLVISRVSAITTTF